MELKTGILHLWHNPMIESQKAIFLLLLAVVSNSAVAKWVEVGATPIFTAYADPATIHKAGRKVKMWDAMDFSITQTAVGKQFRSIQSQREFDCNESSIRLLYSRFYTRQMGNGDVVLTSNIVRDWAPVSPDSIDEILWKFACGKN